MAGSRTSLVLLALLLAACSFDWDRYDSRLGTATGGAGGSAGTGGSGAAGAGGTGGSPTGGGGTGGTGGSMGGGGAGGTGPLGPWGPPQVVAALSDPEDDDDPTFTADLLELYFNSGRGPGSSKIWKATRAQPTDPWGNLVEVTELHTAEGETNCVVAPDGLTLWFSSTRDTPGLFDIFVSTRPDRQSSWSAPVSVPELNSPEDDLVGAVSADGLTIIIDSNRAGGLGGGDIYVAVRPTPTSAWGSPVAVTELNTASSEGQAWLGPQGLTLYFDSSRNGGDDDIFMTTRTTVGGVWDQPVEVTELNTGDDDSDAWVSPDLRYIMFTRGQVGAREIYEAHR